MTAIKIADGTINGLFNVLVSDEQMKNVSVSVLPPNEAPKNSNFYVIACNVFVDVKINCTTCETYSHLLFLLS